MREKVIAGEKREKQMKEEQKKREEVKRKKLMEKPHGKQMNNIRKYYTKRT